VKQELAHGAISSWYQIKCRHNRRVVSLHSPRQNLPKISELASGGQKLVGYCRPASSSLVESAREYRWGRGRGRGGDGSGWGRRSAIQDRTWTSAWLITLVSEPQHQFFILLACVSRGGVEDLTRAVRSSQAQRRRSTDQQIFRVVTLRQFD